ncbi:hypothetical protein QBC34DRAFT_379493 [Podospora aff. communis PSN243]|uniref:Uncharacterized protein n=1 Tax=Podospora aff. communis PSN243 TaxID=3040156 RepID=A0AAV9GNW3_9PEZI|nr:hypothetical protein QBC34DRAFT_379493 [Podospora aff. communis PSN243]
MVRVSTLSALGCLFSSASVLVSGSPLAALNAELARREYTLFNGPIEWKGVLEDGGEEVYLSGATFDEIDTKAKAINPSYTIFDHSAAVEARDASIEARQNIPVSIQCGWPPGWTPTWDFLALDAGINYLKGLQGSCRNPPGPGFCGRVSCSWGSGIYYCNDNRHEIWVPCRDLGDVAHSIVSRCADRGANGRTLGQAFHSGNWNVIVAAGDC